MATTSTSDLPPPSAVSPPGGRPKATNLYESCHHEGCVVNREKRQTGSRGRPDLPDRPSSLSRGLLDGGHPLSDLGVGEGPVGVAERQREGEADLARSTDRLAAVDVEHGDVGEQVAG